jgi:hypothetical protein
LSGPGQSFDRGDLALLLSCAGYLLVNLFSLSGAPILLSGDQVYFWLDALRLLQGQQIYRDFFQFTPPGTDLIFYGAFGLFGPRIWTTNLVVMLTALASCATCGRIARVLLPRPQAVLATLLYLFMILGLTLNATHHLFSALAAFAAIAVLMRGRTATNILIAGALLGLSGFFTQTRGIATAAAAVAWLTIDAREAGERWSRQLWSVSLLMSSLLLAWAALLGHYLQSIGPRALWFFQITYARQHLLQAWQLPSPVSLPKLEQLKWLIAFAAVPIIYLVAGCCVYRRRQRSPAAPTSGALLLTLTGATLYAEVMFGPSWFRVFCVSLPAVVLLMWVLQRDGASARFATPVLWFAVVALGIQQSWSTQRHHAAVLTTPAGRVATTQLMAQKIAWLESHTMPGEYLLQTQWPGLYLPLGLRNPLYVDVLISQGAEALGYTALATQQLQGRATRYIEWSPALDRTGYTIGPFRTFLTRHYQVVQSFSDGDQIWERSGTD